MTIFLRKPRVASFAFGVITTIAVGILAAPAGAHAQVASSSITVLSPNGGEIWTRGTTQTIRWNSTTVAPVSIGLFKGVSYYNVIGHNLPNTGSYQWQVPTWIWDSVLGDDFTVRVGLTAVSSGIPLVDCSNNVCDVSDTPFTISAASTSSIIVTGPVNSYYVGQNTYATWTSTGVSAVSIAACYDANTNCTALASSTLSRDGVTNRWLWYLDPWAPYAGKNDVRIKVTQLGPPGVSDYSDNAFRILKYAFNQYDRVQTTANSYVRPSPGTGNTPLGTQPAGAVGTITNIVPTYVSGYYWWNVNFDSGVDGWVAQTNLRKATTTPSLTASCSATPTSQTTGNGVLWHATSTGGTGVYAYVWQGFAMNGATGPNVTIAYANPGTYAGSVTVMSGTQSTTVSCGQVVITVPPSITVLSPNGGETWQASSTQLVWWTAMPTSSVPGVGIALVNASSGARYGLTPGGTVNDGNEFVRVPSTVPAGYYWLEATAFLANGQSVADRSDGLISVSTTVTPFACAPSAQTVAINPAFGYAPAYFQASGGSGAYSWFAPGASGRTTGSGGSFDTQYAIPGVYQVTVISGGMSATCAVTVQRAQVTLALAVTADTSVAPSDYLTMGSAGNALAAFRFTETSNAEDLKITDVNVVQQVSSVSGVKSAFQNLNLYNGATLVGAAGAANTSANGRAYVYRFHFWTPVIVPRANSLLLALKGDVASWSSSGATDNTQHIFQIGTTSDWNNDTPGEAVAAYGATSNGTSTVTLSNAVGNPMTVLRSKLAMSGSPLGSSVNRAKASTDNLATLALTADPAGDIAVNKITVTFGGTAPANDAFLNGVTLIDNNTGNLLGIGNTATLPCNGSNTCAKTFELGFGTAGQLIARGTSRQLTLRIDSTKTAAGEAGIAQTLTATVNAQGDVQFTDALDAAAASGLGLPPRTVTPIFLNSVSYAAGTFAPPPPPSLPSLTVASPNGGERWTQGSTQTVAWKSVSVPSDTKLTIIARCKQGCATTQTSGNYGTSYSSNTGVSSSPVDYVLASGTPNDGAETIYTSSLPAGTYYLVGVRATVAGTVVEDWSDGTLSVVAPTTQPPATTQTLSTSQLAAILEALRMLIAQLGGMLAR